MLANVIGNGLASELLVNFVFEIDLVELDPLQADLAPRPAHHRLSQIRF